MGNNKGLIQTIISQDYKSMIMCKQFPKSIGIVSPFKKIRNTIISDFVIPKNRKHRVQKIHRDIPIISSYKTINDNNILFDCIEPVFDNTDIFTTGNGFYTATSGFLHFDLIMSEIKNKEGNPCTICDINPRLLIKESEDIRVETTKIPFKIFVTDKIKIFSVMMTKGFISCVVNPKKSTLYLVINQPNQNFVGCCVDYDNIQMIKHIKTVWPIFDIIQSQLSANIKLKKDIIPVPLEKNKTGELTERVYPILVKLERNLVNNVTTVSYIGESLFIP